MFSGNWGDFVKVWTKLLINNRPREIVTSEQRGVSQRFGNWNISNHLFWNLSKDTVMHSFPASFCLLLICSIFTLRNWPLSQRCGCFFKNEWMQNHPKKKSVVYCVLNVATLSLHLFSIFQVRTTKAWQDIGGNSSTQKKKKKLSDLFTKWTHLISVCQKLMIAFSPWIGDETVLSVSLLSTSLWSAKGLYFFFYIRCSEYWLLNSVCITVF